MSGFLSSVAFGVLAIPVVGAAIVVGIVVAVVEARGQERDAERRAELLAEAARRQQAMDAERAAEFSRYVWEVSCEYARTEARELKARWN
jgi:hypothetical protein